MEKFFGILSPLIVLASYPIYIIRIWQRKVEPNISSWAIFVIVSFALSLSSFSSSGEGINSWVTLGPLFGCTAILISALIVSKDKFMSRFDIACLILGCLSIFLWFLSKEGDLIVQIIISLGLLPKWVYPFPDLIWVLPVINPTINFFSRNPEYILYLALFTDFIGLLPSINFLTKHPEKDRPTMWIIFSIGYFFSMFAIKENTFANWILPMFMVIVPSLVWIPLIRYRTKNKIPFKEWI